MPGLQLVFKNTPGNAIGVITAHYQLERKLLAGEAGQKELALQKKHFWKIPRL